MPILSKYIQPEVLNRIAHARFDPKQLVEGTLAGAHKSPFHGFAVEFAGHRDYVPGDDIRHLDWKVYYRHRRYLIKQYEMDTNLVCHLMLDVSSSMRYGEGDAQKLLYASRMATTLAHLVVEESDRVSLTTFDERIVQSLAASNSLGQIVNMGEMLDKVEPVKKTRIGPSLMELAARAGRRSIVVIFSDFFVDLDDLNDAIQRLRYDKHEVVLMQVLHNDEIEFKLPGMIRFVGLEEDNQVLARPDDMRDSYLEAMRQFNERLESIATANQSERLVCDTSQDMAVLFADYLHTRSLADRRL
ncbi:MAG: DUF58 domain-containing protein [Kiritimatiellia bacterium]|jgi:uncharacterized protein (DUF58 family)|nr:DUF58 domain-containing protein [Kiritimatiellia bacterium]